MFSKLCYILLLHQTTTVEAINRKFRSCVISYFYIKPQLAILASLLILRCVISYFYIKPQRYDDYDVPNYVVLYLTSTSNHNTPKCAAICSMVVLYLTSTSNHNFAFDYLN